MRLRPPRPDRTAADPAAIPHAAMAGSAVAPGAPDDPHRPAHWAVPLGIRTASEWAWRGLVIGAAAVAVLDITNVLSEVVTGVVWRQILRPDGLLDQGLDAVGATGLTHEWLADPELVLYSLFFIISWKYFGFHMVIILAGLQQLPRELHEAASIDGASSWQSFRYITLPLLGPTLRVSLFLSIIGALQLFDLVWVTTKGGPIGASSTMATFLYDQFRKGLFGYASAVSIVIFGLSLVVALFYQRVALRRDLEGTGLVG